MNDPMEEARKKIEGLSDNEQEMLLKHHLDQLQASANDHEREQAAGWFAEAMEDETDPPRSDQR